jgi:hypothetical protein
MVASAAIQIRLAGDPNLLFGHRLDANPSPLDERMEPPARGWAGLVVDDYSDLQEIAGRYQAHGIA